MSDGDRLTYTIPEVAAQLGLKPRTVYAWAEHGQLPTIRVGKRVLVPVAALEQWLYDQTKTVTRVTPLSPVPKPRSSRRRRRVLADEGF